MRILAIDSSAQVASAAILSDEAVLAEYSVDYRKTHGKKIIHGHIPVDYSFMTMVVEQNENYDFIVLDNGVYETNQPGLGNLMAYNPDTKQLIAQSNMDL